MSVEHRHTFAVAAGGETLSYAVSLTAGQEINIDETIPASNPTTDLAVALAIDVSQLISIFLVADIAMTLEFNSASAPSKTLTMVANVPFQWTNTSQHANPFVSTDVTGLFVTMAGAVAGRLRGKILIDPVV